MSKTIILSKRYEAIVDDEDYEYLNQFKWHARVVSGTQYAKRSVRFPKNTTINMHRQIMNCPKNKMIDHINGDGLDNRKINLRVCTRSQNLMNSKKPKDAKTSKYKGVCLSKQTDNHEKCWRAEIRLNKKSIYLGAFYSETDAAKAYNKAAIKYFGEFAQLNEIKDV